MKNTISGWGLFPKKRCTIIQPKNAKELKAAIQKHQTITPRGLGRSYGDSSLGDVVLSSLKLNQILSLDRNEGIIDCQSGVSFDQLLREVVPFGFFPPVTPGTKFITIGGALASDVHGKNHHTDGVFSDHVIQIKLVDAQGNLSTVKPGSELFEKTAGGMGTTGYIYSVHLRLQRIETSYIKQINYKAQNLKHIFELFEQHRNASYSVAWIDCLRTGNTMGRSILMIGEHASASEVKNTSNLLTPHKNPKINIPFFFPSLFLNRFFISGFNFLFYNNPLKPIGKSFVSHYDAFFYPLDKIKNWNRIYGKKGFVQYQFVVPLKHSFVAISEILNILSQEKVGSFLSVLKLFGQSHEHRYLHFPMKGYTLALDIKVSPKIFKVLERCDQIINAHGGKIYLTKDSRMAPETFRSQYPSVPPVGAFKSLQTDRILSKPKKTMKTLLVIGANSDIAKACITAWIGKNPHSEVVLCSRNTVDMAEFIEQNGLKNTTAIPLDLSQKDSFSQLQDLRPTEILYAAGVMHENSEAATQPDLTSDMMQVNYTAAVTLINELVSRNRSDLKRIVGISSIAGLRGRKGNYIYGSSKAGFHQYLFGLRQALKPEGILVQAITPGFVKTKMTSHLNLGKMADTPETIGRLFISKSTCFERYPSLKWKIIGSLVKVLPEFLISRL